MDHDKLKLSMRRDPPCSQDIDQKLIGSICGIAEGNPPDMIFAVLNLGRFNVNLSLIHCICTKWVPNYLKRTNHLKISKSGELQVPGDETECFKFSGYVN